MLFTCQGTTGVPCRIVVCFMASLYTNGGKCQQLYYKNIAQKSAADFMQIDEMDIIYIIVYNSWTTIMPLRQIVSIYIAICYTDQNSYNIVTICFIVVSVYYLIWHIRCYDVDNQIIGYLIIGKVMLEMVYVVFNKNHIMCNTRYITPIIY